MPPLESWEDTQTWPYQRNLQFPQDSKPSRINLWGEYGRKRELVWRLQGPRIGGGARNTVVEKINYNHNLSLIKTLPTSSTLSTPQPHTNDPIADSVCTGHYLYALTTIVHTREPSENSINVKLPNSSKMASTHQAQIQLENLSSQEKHAEIFPNLHSSLISIGKLCDN